MIQKHTPFLLDRYYHVLGLFLLCFLILLSIFPEPYNASCSVWSAGRDSCTCPLWWQARQFWESRPWPLLWYTAGASARHKFPREDSCVAGLHAHCEQQSMQRMLTGYNFFSLVIYLFLFYTNFCLRPYPCVGIVKSWNLLWGDWWTNP